MALALLVNVRELALIQLFPVFRIELRHWDSFLFLLEDLLHTLFRLGLAAADPTEGPPRDGAPAGGWGVHRRVKRVSVGPAARDYSVAPSGTSRAEEARS